MSALFSFFAEGESPFLYRSGASPGEVDHIYDPVKSPVDVVADHHAGFARAVSPQDTYPIALHVSWLVYLGGTAHGPLSPYYKLLRKGYYGDRPFGATVGLTV
jgi:hypothetical protein